eukprot:15443227-Alexandrium_andersonii.AAC.1
MLWVAASCVNSSAAPESATAEAMPVGARPVRRAARTAASEWRAPFGQHSAQRATLDGRGMAETPAAFG